MKKIGFIGVGIMGQSMVKNLIKAGYELHIYARTPAKVSNAVSAGAKLYKSIAECINGCDTVITIVGYPKDVEEVYFNSGNIMDSAAKGTFLIDMTTTSPELSVKLFNEGSRRGFHVIDAPVTGGEKGAQSGTLSILAGGNKDDFEKCVPIFKALGTNINYQGKAGCGQHAKMANQIMIAGTLSGVCEALAYADAKGLNKEVLLKSVSTGAAGSKQLDFFGEKIINGDYSASFFLKHFVKDMSIALDEAKKSGLNLEVLNQVLQNYKELEDEGNGNLGTQSLIKHYKK